VPHIAAFFDELQTSGFIDGQKLTIDGGCGLQGDLSPTKIAAMRKFGPDVIFSSADRWSGPLREKLVINLRTAKAVDLEIPAGLVLSAEKLIE
jgi:hypothetical protein